MLGQAILHWMLVCNLSGCYPATLESAGARRQPKCKPHHYLRCERNPTPPRKVIFPELPIPRSDDPR